MAIYDEIIFKAVRDAEETLEKHLNADVLYFYSEIRMNVFAWFRETIEKLSERPEQKDALAIVLTTPGGQAEAAEKLVEVVRAHYPLVYFVIPVAAMSAGTIFCMSAPFRTPQSAAKHPLGGRQSFVGCPELIATEIVGTKVFAGSEGAKNGGSKDHPLPHLSKRNG